MDRKEIWSKIRWMAPVLVPPAIAVGLVLISFKFESPSVLVLTEPGCQAVQVAGVRPTPLKDGLCSVTAKKAALWHSRYVEISGISINRDFVVASGKAAK